MPQPALNVDMDAQTNVESLSFSFDPTKGVLPIVFIQNQLTAGADPDPDPEHQSAAAAAGRAADRRSANSKLLKDTAKLNPDAGDLARRWPRPSARRIRVSAPGTLDVLRYGRPLKARQLVGVRGAGLAYDGLYYVQSVTSTLKRGEFKQSFDADAQRSDLDHAEGAGMSDAAAQSKFYGKYRGTVLNNIDPHAAWAACRCRCRTSPASFRRAGRCRASRSPATRTACSPCRMIGSGVWVEFEQGDPDYPIWVGCFWGSAAEVPALAPRDAAGRARHHAADAACRTPS